MPARSNNSGLWTEQQPKYVEIPPMGPSLNDVVRPQFEKMLSCDLSVEESLAINDNYDQDITKMMCGFPKKSVRDRYPPISASSRFDFANDEEAAATYKKIGLESTSFQIDPSSLPDLEEEQAAFKKLDFERSMWKVGAVESEKSRSPTEHDEMNREDPKSFEEESVDCKQNEESYLLEKKPQKCAENFEAEVQLKDKNLPLDAATFSLENTLQVKRKSTTKKKSKSPLKRQSIGKKKKNKWVILCVEEPLKPVKKKVTLTKKNYSPKVHNKHHHTSHCKDSGVGSGSSYDSGSASGGESGSKDYSSKSGGKERGGGGGCGGGGGFHRNGGMGGAGRDDDSDEKRPFGSGDTEMKDEGDTEDDLKMKSKGSSDMDCEYDSLEEHSVEWQNLHFQTQHLQHGCYCSRNEDCDRPLCVQMKKELKHFKAKFSKDCPRCQKMINLLKMHAATCRRPGCRVPRCMELRAKKEVQFPQGPKDQYHDNQKPVSPPLPPSIDGQVLYLNSPQFGRFFQEHINYQKGKLLGKGTNGNVYEVHFPPGHVFKEISMVVKETNYPINMEELDVYKSMGNHENIVHHHCVTFKGCEYRLAVFMDKCEKSLKDICDVRPMDTNEAMFYWTQVLAAVVYLHDRYIIHKDIKAKNIMLSELPGQGEYCRAKLADYDSAKKLESEFTQSGLKPMGTRGFVAPEVLEKKPHGRPADVYSMGCLLLELHGITPRQELLSQQISKLHDKDPYQAELVLHCVQQDYCKRPTAKQLINHPYVQEFLRVPSQL